MTASLSRRAAMPFLAVPAALRIRRFVRRRPAFEEAFRFFTNFRAPGDCEVKITQRHSEIAALCDIVREQRPQTVLEIGTEHGGTLFLFAEAAADDAILVSVDLPHPGGYRRHRGLVYRAFARAHQRVVPLRADSHDLRTRARVESVLGGRPVDFLFIDGDHTSAGIARDYELYAPLVRPGGIVAIHDIVPGAPEAVGGVPDFWEGLKSGLGGDVVELVEDWDQGGFGIGLLRRD